MPLKAQATNLIVPERERGREEEKRGGGGEEGGRGGRGYD